MLDALTRTHVPVCRIAGIPIGLNASWFPVFLVVLWSLATGFLPHAAPGAGPVALWVAALVGTILFFASVLAHELGHALTAVRSGIGVSSITLFVLGGVSRIAEEPRTAGEELRIAAAGPAVSLLVSLLFGACGLAVDPASVAASIALYLVLVNAALALFNLVPALPLDGGRVLRALLWAVTGDPGSATKWAAWSGRACGAAFAGVGLIALAFGAFVPAAWLVALGIFIERSARGSVDTIELDVHLRTDVNGLAVRTGDSMDQARFQRLERRVIEWRARLDVLPRPGELLEENDPAMRRYQDDCQRMHEILGSIDEGIRADASDEQVEAAFGRLSELYDEWRPVAATELPPEAGEESMLAGRPERFAPDPDEALHREPGSSIEV